MIGKTPWHSSLGVTVSNSWWSFSTCSSSGGHDRPGTPVATAVGGALTKSAPSPWPNSYIRLMMCFRLRARWLPQEKHPRHQPIGVGKREHDVCPVLSPLFLESPFLAGSAMALPYLHKATILGGPKISIQAFATAYVNDLTELIDSKFLGIGAVTRR